MLNLIRNENMKIYRRLRTWIMVGILLVIFGIMATIIKVNEPEHEIDWKKTYQADIAGDQMLLKQPNLDDDVRERAEERVKTKQYAIEHDIEPADHTLWGEVENAGNLIILITIFTVIVAGDAVAGEFSMGTIKMLLIRPASRAKILLSKYIASFLFALFLMALLFGVSFVVNAILYGIGGIDLVHLNLNDAGKVVETNYFFHTVESYLLASVSLIMIVTLAFMNTSAFRSSSLAIGLSIFLLFIGSTITGIFVSLEYDWIKYWLFTNIDLTMYTMGTPPVEGMTMAFSVTILLIHFAIFNVVSWWIFTKRDVAA